MSMKITRLQVLFSILAAIVLAAIGLRLIGRPILVTWVRAHATVRLVESPPGGRFGVAVFRYPRMGHVPELLGLGQGYVQLYELDSGEVFQEKVAPDLAAIHLFAWGPSSVTIQGFVEWEIPGR